MIFCEDDYLPISALQHFIYCMRRCALVHLERLWMDNILTAQGVVGHINVDKSHHEKRSEIYRAYRLQLTSRTYGLTGFADLVEFIRDEKGVRIPYIARQDRYRIVPVEFKRGAAKEKLAYQVQLCAQTLCLEQMFGCSITTAYLFEEKKSHREPVDINESLRAQTIKTIGEMRALLTSMTTPQPHFESKCSSCSLIEFCMPKAFSKKGGGSGYWLKFYSQEKACENS